MNWCPTRDYTESTVPRHSGFGYGAPLRLRNPNHNVHDVRARRADPDQRVGRCEGGVRIVTLQVPLRIPAGGGDTIPCRSVDDRHPRRRSGRRGRPFRPRAGRPVAERPADRVRPRAPVPANVRLIPVPDR